jgi:hypothetical protein
MNARIEIASDAGTVLASNGDRADRAAGSAHAVNDPVLSSHDHPSSRPPAGASKSKCAWRTFRPRKPVSLAPLTTRAVPSWRKLVSADAAQGPFADADRPFACSNNADVIERAAGCPSHQALFVVPEKSAPLDRGLWRKSRIEWSREEDSCSTYF